MAVVPPLVSAEWLREKLAEGATDVILLEASFDSASHHGASEKFLQDHIKGALFYDMNACITPRPTCARNLQNADEYREYIQSLGVNKTSHVIVYDRNFIFSSAKAWWTFRVFGHNRVSVLDGGFFNWKAKGYELESGECKTQPPGDFDITLNPSLKLEFDAMVQIARDQSAQIIDCRMEEHFSGTDPEPSYYTKRGLDSMNMPIPACMRSGHVRGAVNIVFFRVMDMETQIFLSKEQLINISDSGVDLKRPLVSTCYMGHTAALISLAAYVCGYDNTALYYGSWTEFGQIGPAELIVGPEEGDQTKQKL